MNCEENREKNANNDTPKRNQKKNSNHELYIYIVNDYSTENCTRKSIATKTARVNVFIYDESMFSRQKKIEKERRAPKTGKFGR